MPSLLTCGHWPDVGPMISLSGKLIGPMAAKSHRPDRGCRSARWRAHTGRLDGLPTKRRSNPALTRETSIKPGIDPAAGHYDFEMCPKDTKNTKSKCSNHAYLLCNRTTLHISSLHNQPCQRFGHLCATLQLNDMHEFKLYCH